MKREWQVRRQFSPTADAERRWDRAYQHLLTWTALSEPVSAPVPRLCSPIEGEARREDNSDLRSGINGSSGAGTNDRATARTPETHLEMEGETLSSENVYRDDGYSGASLNRPGLDQPRDRVRRSVVNRVMITSPDRLARNYVHQMVVIEELERAGCSVEFLDRPMSQDPHDQLLLQIRGAVAEYERVLIAERMRRGRQLRLRSGTMLPWTLPPYGYRSAPDCPRDPSSVHIEPAERRMGG